MPSRAPGKSVSAAVRREIRDWKRRSPEIAQSGLAATALVLAGELDDPSNSATSKAMCARTLRETLDRLRELLPADEAKDTLDDLSAKRTARRRRAVAENRKPS